MDSFVFTGGKKLRRGFTTGTCAAAASAAAVRILFGGSCPHGIRVTLPGGEDVVLDVETMEILDSGIRCSVRKDAGDDPDITDGMLVCALAEIIDPSLESPLSSKILIEGGKGVGKVTRSGLDQPIGMAAINTVPRKMIEEAVLRETQEVGFTGCIRITVSIPGGEEAAKKTFNPRLGIEGGLSILGTTGMVEPMSDEAIVETIKLLIMQKLLEDGPYLLVTPGNYGKDFIRKELCLDSESAVICSNFIGKTIDIANGADAKGMLICGHIGKLCKLASGIMNTHSRVADGRQEIFCSCALLAGSDKETAIRMLHCVSTEEAIRILQEKDLIIPFVEVLMQKIEEHLVLRAGTKMKMAAIIFANDRKCLGKTDGADELLQLIRNQQQMANNVITDI